MLFLQSNDTLAHPEELRARMRRDGYLFFQALIDAAAIREVRRDILTLCRDAGWLAEGSDLMEAVVAPEERHVEPEPDYMVVYDEVMKLLDLMALRGQVRVEKGAAAPIENEQTAADSPRPYPYGGRRGQEYSRGRVQPG